MLAYVPDIEAECGGEGAPAKLPDRVLTHVNHRFVIIHVVQVAFIALRAKGGGNRSAFRFFGFVLFLFLVLDNSLFLFRFCFLFHFVREKKEKEEKKKGELQHNVYGILLALTFYHYVRE